MATKVVLQFGDGEYTFHLTVNGIIELQEVTKAGFGDLTGRVLSGRYVNSDGSTFGYPLEAKYRIEDLLNTIRLALIGGGGGTVNGQTVEMNPVRAGQLVQAYCYPERPLTETWTLAAAIMAATVEGVVEATKDTHSVKKKRQRAPTRKA